MSPDDGWISLGRPAAGVAGGGSAALAVAGEDLHVVVLDLAGSLRFARLRPDDLRPASTAASPTWTVLATGVGTGPQAIVCAGRVEVFAIDSAARRIVHASIEAGQPAGGGHALESPFAVERIAVASCGPGHVDVLAGNADADLFHARCRVEPQPAALVTDWELMAREVHDPPAFVSWGADRLDVFWSSPDGSLRHKWWDNAPGRLDAFSPETAADAQHKWWHPGVGWLPAPAGASEGLGGGLTSPPTAISRSVHQLDLYARDGRRHLVHKWWNPESGWMPSIGDVWEPMGGILAAGPSATAWGAGSMDVLALLADHTAALKRFDPALGWWPALTMWRTIGQEIPGRLAGRPLLATLPDGGLVAVALGADGDVLVGGCDLPPR